MYDVDTLFVIRKDTWNRPSIDLNEIIKKYDENHKDNKALVMEKGITVTGFDSKGKQKIGKLGIEDYLQGVMVKVAQSSEKLRLSLLDNKMSPVEKKKVEAQLALLNKDFDDIHAAIDLAAKNGIVHLLSTNMLDMKNRKDLLTPISFQRVAAIKSKTPQEMSELLDSEEFLQELADARLIEYKCKTV